LADFFTQEVDVCEITHGKFLHSSVVDLHDRCSLVAVAHEAGLFPKEQLSGFRCTSCSPICSARRPDCAPRPARVRVACGYVWSLFVIESIGFGPGCIRLIFEEGNGAPIQGGTGLALVLLSIVALLILSRPSLVLPRGRPQDTHATAQKSPCRGCARFPGGALSRLCR
jgi:hypothetical protein